jgi:hypothetical protein
MVAMLGALDLKVFELGVSVGTIWYHAGQTGVAG